jgi:uncharacterized membrane protein
MSEDRSRLRVWLVRGTIALLPTLLTMIVVIICFNFLNGNVGRPIGTAILWAADKGGGEPADKFVFGVTDHHIAELRESPFAVSVIGFPIALILLFILAIFLATVAGRTMIRLTEMLLRRLPLVKAVYPYAKQFTDFFAPGEGKPSGFKRVAMVQYPRKGLYCVAFVTSDGVKQIDAASGRRHLGVFIPTSPTPFTGFTVFIPKDEVITLDMTVDEAVRFVISGGVLVPPSQQMAPQEGAGAALQAPGRTDA